MKQGALIFNELTDRYDIRFDLADYYDGLNCGSAWRYSPGASGSRPALSTAIIGILWVPASYACYECFPLLPTTGESVFLPKQSKRKTLQSSLKAATLFLAYSVFLFDFCNLFRRCGYNPYPLIAHTVKQRVELPPLRRFLGCLIREKELVYGYVITGYKLIEDLQARLLPFVLNVRKIAWVNVHFVAYFLAALIPACPRRFYRLPESCKVI
jgi:hypothetical protein